MTIDRDRVQRFLTAIQGKVGKLRILARQDVTEFLYGVNRRLESPNHNEMQALAMGSCSAGV